MWFSWPWLALVSRKQTKRGLRERKMQRRDATTLRWILQGSISPGPHLSPAGSWNLPSVIMQLAAPTLIRLFPFFSPGMLYLNLIFKGNAVPKSNLAVFTVFFFSPPLLSPLQHKRALIWPFGAHEHEDVWTDLSCCFVRSRNKAARHVWACVQHCSGRRPGLFRTFFWRAWDQRARRY